jgi:hypothetical protein
MALEIREIEIRMRVGGSGDPADEAEGPDAPERDGVDREAIVEECVRRVLRAIRMVKER